MDVSVMFCGGIVTYVSISASRVQKNRGIDAKYTHLKFTRSALKK